MVNFKKNNLHVVNFSEKVDKIITLEKLQKKIHTNKKLKNAIPYVTSYYKKTWGFCMEEGEFKKLPKGKYKAYIDSDFKKGHLELFCKSKDWTKDFKLKIHHNTKNKIKNVKLVNNQKFLDGRSTQIHYLFAKFLKKFNYTNVNFALNAEKINNRIK